MGMYCINAARFVVCLKRVREDLIMFVELEIYNVCTLFALIIRWFGGRGILPLDNRA